MLSMSKRLSWCIMCGLVKAVFTTFLLPVLVLLAPVLFNCLLHPVVKMGAYP